MAWEPLCSPALPALWGATPVGCSGFSSWASGYSGYSSTVQTRVTAESQRFGFLKHETWQTRRYSFPLCSWSSLAAPTEPPQCPPGSGWGRRRAPTWEAETGNSYSTAQRSLDIFSSLAFFKISFLLEKKFRLQLDGILKLRSLFPAQRGRGSRLFPSIHASTGGPRACPRAGAPVLAHWQCLFRAR